MLRLSSLVRPQYLLRPSQIVRRVLRELRNNPQEKSVSLPWHLELEIDPDDTVSDALLAQGLYDLVTSEVLWRLTAAGDRTADIGANVGYMSSILARRAGANGLVLAFEPFASTFRILQRNAERWNVGSQTARVVPHQAAVSNHDGEATLVAHENGDRNASHAFLSDSAEPIGTPVPIVSFARFFEEAGSFGVIKVDAERHEAQIFEGMGQRLSDGSVRDILFEEECPYPAASHAVLLKSGYQIFGFEERLKGPRLVSPEELSRPKGPYDQLPSYLATREALRAKKLLEVTGWQCLRG